MINLDDNEEDIDMSQSVEIEIEQYKKLGHLMKLLYAKYDMPNEYMLHFVVENNSKPLILDPKIQCAAICNSCVSIFQIIYSLILLKCFYNRFLYLSNDTLLVNPTYTKK